MDLTDSVKGLEGRKENSFDLIAKDEGIYAIPGEGLGLMVGVMDKGRWPLTERAHSQLAEKLGTPKVL